MKTNSLNKLVKNFMGNNELINMPQPTSVENLTLQQFLHGKQIMANKILSIPPNGNYDINRNTGVFDKSHLSSDDQVTVNLRQR